jgi:hypothetical protein
MANLCTRRKSCRSSRKGSRTHCKEKTVSLSLIGRMTFLVELWAALNTQDAFMASFLRCRGKLVFQMMLRAIRSVIYTREILKISLKRK